MLSILTVNIGAAVQERAEALLGWLRNRPEDVFVLTETSAGRGTAFLFERFRAAGFSVIERPATSERGVGLVSRIPFVEDLSEQLEEITIPGRAVGVELTCDPRIIVLGVYVPSRDTSFAKVEKKRKFLESLTRMLAGMQPEKRESTILGGDYNVISRCHTPLHPGFLPFEFRFLEDLERFGLTDVYRQMFPDHQPYSWIGRTGAGYRYDYFHVGHRLASRVNACSYLHETRELKLTDHAALSLCVDSVPLQTPIVTDPAVSDSLTLF